MGIGSVRLLTVGDLLCTKLVGHSVECQPQNSCGIPRISSVLAQIGDLAGDLVEVFSELFTGKTRLRVITR